MDLNTTMDIGHVVYVRDDGTVVDKTNVHAPEIVCDYTGPFAEAQILDEHDREMMAYAERQGWTIQNGWSGQYGYSGPIMHTAEFIGGSLAEHILETPGFWVAESVDLQPRENDPEYNDGNGESDLVGWVLAFRPAVHYGESTTACGDETYSDDHCVTETSKVTCPVCLEVIHRPV